MSSCRTGDGERGTAGLRANVVGRRQDHEPSIASAPSSATRRSSKRNRRAAAPNWAFRLNPDGASKQRDAIAIVHGLDWTQTFSRNVVLRREPPAELLRLPRHGVRGPVRPALRRGGPAGGDDELRARRRTSRAWSFTRFMQKTNTLPVQGCVREPDQPRAPDQDRRRVAASRRCHSARRAFLVYTSERGRRRCVRLRTTDPPDYPGDADLLAGHRRRLRPGSDRVERPDAARRAALRLLRCALHGAERPREPGERDPGRAAVDAGGRPPPRSPSRRGSACRTRSRTGPRCTSRTDTSTSSRRSARSSPTPTTACSRTCRRAESSYGVMGNPDVEAGEDRAVRVRLQAGADADVGLDVTVVLQGHPRPARRRVHLDVQRRGVRAAHQRRLRRRARASPWRSITGALGTARHRRSTTPGSRRRATRATRARRRRAPRRARIRARAWSRSTGTSATRST